MAAQIRAAVGPMLQARGAALSDVESLGAVVPGSIDAAGETVVDAHNLNFHNVPLRKILSDAFPGIPVYIANDANGAALAELYTGAFVGCKTGVLLTLGTGLGGGIILNGKMFNGGMNHGVELGHAYLVDGGEPCTCGNLGCMEAYCAASALTRDGRRAMQAHPESMLAEQTGGDPGKITPKLVTDCAKAGDAAAKAVFDTYIEHLSSACASVYNILDPEVLAIGGGLSAAGPFLFDPLQEKVSEKVLLRDPRQAGPGGARQRGRHGRRSPARARRKGVKRFRRGGQRLPYEGKLSPKATDGWLLQICMNPNRKFRFAVTSERKKRAQEGCANQKDCLDLLANGFRSVVVASGGSFRRVFLTTPIFSLAREKIGRKGRMGTVWCILPLILGRNRCFHLAFHSVVTLRASYYAPPDT